MYFCFFLKLHVYICMVWHPRPCFESSRCSSVAPLMRPLPCIFWVGPNPWAKMPDYRMMNLTPNESVKSWAPARILKQHPHLPRKPRSYLILWWSMWLYFLPHIEYIVFFKFNRRHRLPTGLLALPCLVVQFQRPLCSYDMFLFMSYSIFMWYHLLLLDPGREGEERSQSQAQTLVRGQSETWWGSQASGASMAPQRVEAAGSLRNGHGISRLWIR